MAKDLFSKRAKVYAKYRPSYPAQLIEYIISYVNQRGVALDCATGNGQAAVLLAPHFKKVFAIDVSENQIAEAFRHPNITYLQGESEKTSFKDNSFDLITVAQAYHWFHFEAFSKEAARIGKADAIIAVWGYGLISTGDRKLNAAINDFYTIVVGKYWDPERRYIDLHYETIPFYFEELPAKNFKMHVKWKAGDLIGYLNSWSSVQHFLKANHVNPVDKFSNDLDSVWEKDTERSFSFPLFLRLGILKK